MNHGVVTVAAGVILLSVGALSFSQEGRGGDLPEGADVIGTGQTTCDGPLMVESGAEREDDVRRIPRGENRVMRVDNPNVSWVCLGENGTHSDTMECPAETTHVRIERRDDEGVTAFECYGRGR